MNCLTLMIGPTGVLPSTAIWPAYMRSAPNSPAWSTRIIRSSIARFLAFLACWLSRRQQSWQANGRDIFLVHFLYVPTTETKNCSTWSYSLNDDTAWMGLLIFVRLDYLFIVSLVSYCEIPLIEVFPSTGFMQQLDKANGHKQLLIHS